MSRVRKQPPGGDSSFNIFGVPNEPKKATENITQKATDNSIQKATDNSTQKATDNTQNATSNEESHVTTDDAVAKEDETRQKAEDKNEDDKEKKDDEAEEEKEKEKEEVKEAVDQNSANAATPAAVDVKDSPAKGENTQNTPESTKNKPKVAYNPITGQPYGSPVKTETEAPKQVGHTRVRQSPGGTSSKLW
jgi:membrane protein involved in colicin uptake